MRNCRKQLRKYLINLIFNSKCSINKIDFTYNYTYKKDFEHHISECKYLTDNEKEIIKKIIGKLPDGSKLCHGDFHPGNVMYYEGKYYIIDWALGMQGTMAYDVARTVMMMKYVGIQ